jgi:hypothetical protein
MYSACVSLYISFSLLRSSYLVKELTNSSLVVSLRCPHSFLNSSGKSWLPLPAPFLALETRKSPQGPNEGTETVTDHLDSSFHQVLLLYQLGRVDRIIVPVQEPLPRLYIRPFLFQLS